MAPATKKVPPPVARKGPSVTPLAERTEGLNPRSNWKAYRSTAPEIEILNEKLFAPTIPRLDGCTEIVPARAGQLRKTTTGIRAASFGLTGPPPSAHLAPTKRTPGQTEAAGRQNRDR